jgi:hypothetical protein
MRSFRSNAMHITCSTFWSHTAVGIPAAAAASVAANAADNAQFPLKGHAHRLQRCMETPCCCQYCCCCCNISCLQCCRLRADSELRRTQHLQRCTEIALLLEIQLLLRQLLQHQLPPMLLTMRSFRSKAMHIACSAA